MPSLSLREKQDQIECIMGYMYLNCGWRTPGDMAKALGLGSAGTVGCVLKQLIDDKLVVSTQQCVRINSHNRRRSVYKLTPKGKRFINDLIKRANHAANLNQKDQRDDGG